VTKNGFREDIDTAHVYKTVDFGETWTSLSAGLPEKPVEVIIQDRKNPDLLFVGTDRGVFVSIDGGLHWTSFKNNMPWVEVTDMVIHPRENDLVVGTYGRGLYITDITPLQELDAKVLAANVHLFAIKPTVQRVEGAISNYQLLGDSHLIAPNEPNAVTIHYYLKTKPAGKVKITVTTPFGEAVNELEGTAEPGLNRVHWDMTKKAEGGGPMRMMRRAADRWVEPGEYVVTLEVDGTKLSRKAVIPKRAGWSYGPFPSEIKRAFEN